MLDGDGDAGQTKEVKLKNAARPNHRGWRIPTNVAGPVMLSFLPMRSDGLGPFETASLYYLLRFIGDYGTLGAKASHGQGVVKVSLDGFSDVMDLNEWMREARSKSGEKPDSPEGAPDMRDFVGATLVLDSTATSKAGWWKAIPLTGLESFNLGDDPSWIPSAPAVRAKLREWLRNPGTVPRFSGDLALERHRIMGRGGQGPKGSDVFVTHLYRAESQWAMRIYGFVPRNGNEVDQALRGLLKDSNRLAAMVKTALGGIPVGVAPYPDGITSLLGTRSEG